MQDPRSPLTPLESIRSISGGVSLVRAVEVIEGGCVPSIRLINSSVVVIRERADRCVESPTNGVLRVMDLPQRRDIVTALQCPEERKSLGPPGIVQGEMKVLRFR